MPSDPELAVRPRDRRPFAPVIYVGEKDVQAACTACDWKSEVGDDRRDADRINELGREHVRQVHGVEPIAY